MRCTPVGVMGYDQIIGTKCGLGLADVQRDGRAAEGLAQELAAQEGGGGAGAGDDLQDLGDDLMLQPGQRLGGHGGQLGLPGRAAGQPGGHGGGAGDARGGCGAHGGGLASGLGLAS
jgi:hypothetical protein